MLICFGTCPHGQHPCCCRRQLSSSFLSDTFWREKDVDRMTRASVAFLAIIACFSICALKANADPTISSFSYAFQTTTNDKDWNTEVGAEVYCPNHQGAVARRFDFNHDHNVDHWPDGSYNGPWNLPISDYTVKKSEIRNCNYRVSARAGGNDRWDFNAILYLTFADGTAWSWTFQNLSLDSRGSSPVHNDNPMGSPTRCRFAHNKMAPAGIPTVSYPCIGGKTTSP
jgi:hypothetical protein